MESVVFIAIDIQINKCDFFLLPFIGGNMYLKYEIYDLPNNSYFYF